MTRDPRTDPQPDDVLHLDGVRWIVVCTRGYIDARREPEGPEGAVRTWVRYQWIDAMARAEVRS